MTDISADAPGVKHHWGSREAKQRVRRRYAADRRLQGYGIAAITVAVSLLGILLASLVYSGYLAFYTTKVELSVFVDPSVVDKQAPERGNYRKLMKDAVLELFPGVEGRREQREIGKIVSSGAPFILRDRVVDNPELIGQLVKIRVPVSDPFDQFYKGVIPGYIDSLPPRRVELFERLERRGVIVVEGGRGLVKVDAYIDPDAVDADAPGEGEYDSIVKEAFSSLMPGVRAALYSEMLAKSAPDALRDYVVDNPGAVGRTVQIGLPLSEEYDELARTGEAKMLNPRFSSPQVLEQFNALVDRGIVRTPFTWELLFNADSRFPELAGLAGAISGSFLALLTCFLISFPVGISAAIYLEEFAPKNRLSDLIEVNINNLAAVPSVVFGLLGLAVFLNTFGLPRSAPIVGGMVLSLMTLPTIIVSARAALKAVPPSIREAALGVGASRHQVVLHHVLPLAMPGILTGTIIGLAQALGETAPLLLIGMNAFIPSVENIGLLQPATALPTQIFSWADSPERGFVSRTSAAILVLLGFLLVMNAIAIFLRQRFQRRW